MEQQTLDATRIEQGVQALTLRSREARPLVMKWAVSTVALADIVRTERGVEVTWAEIGAVTARWLEDFGRSTGKWKSHAEAALRLSKMDSDRPSSVATEPEGWFGAADRWVIAPVQRHGMSLLRVSLGIVFIWFGALEALGSSPAGDLLAQSLVFVSPKILMTILGAWDVVIGVGLLWWPLLRPSLLLLLLRLPFAALPLIFARDVCYTHFPFALSFDGEYSIHELVLLGAAMVAGVAVLRSKK